ncbi:MAG: ABC transporter ATP-binding protein, partial [Tannerella sp.]|nr:ABC transporter ATP-binding protein [Tannerella sp.]
MKDFFRVLRRFVPPYKKHLILNIVFNVLSAIFNVFTFALIVPILEILFKLNDKVYIFMDWAFEPFSAEWWKTAPDIL